jgi:hypothetical protein
MGWGHVAGLTGVLMMLGGSAHAYEEPINGRWAIDPQGCMIEGDTSETAPLYVTDTSLKWWVASCRVGKSYKVGNALYIQARCANEGTRSSISVKLDLVSRDKLAVTWDHAKVPDMRRCK